MDNKLTVGGDLSQRKKLILRSVIESHISTGEPIGSKYLMTNSEIPYSSATIRNEMAELENMGYLEQPHTSAGRIPTSLGYRFYVDTLMESYKLTATEIVSLNNIIKNKMGAGFHSEKRLQADCVDDELYDGGGKIPYRRAHGFAVFLYASRADRFSAGDADVGWQCGNKAYPNGNPCG